MKEGSTYLVLVHKSEHRHSNLEAQKNRHNDGELKWVKKRAKLTY